VVAIGGLISSTALALVLPAELVNDGGKRSGCAAGATVGRMAGGTDALVTRSGDVPEQVGASV
jgi:hypothetical protein